jgi:hypothetical protein
MYKNRGKMKYSFWILIIVFSFTFYGCSRGESEKVTFQCPVSLLQESSLTKGKKPSDKVEINVDGTLYKSPKTLVLVGKEKDNHDTPFSAVVSTISANKSNDAEWILNNFIEEERDQINSLIENKEAFEKYKAYQTTIKDTQIIGEVKFENHIIYLMKFIQLDGNERKVLGVYVKTKTGWKQTNSLVNDDNFTLMYTAYAGGKVFEKSFFEKLFK